MGSSRFSFPMSMSFITAAAVKVLDALAMRNFMDEWAGSGGVSDAFPAAELQVHRGVSIRMMIPGVAVRAIPLVMTD